MSLHSRFQKIVSLVVTLCFFLTSLVAPAAHASVPDCNNAYAADSGQLQGCAAVRIGGTPVPYPLLKWDEVGVIDINTQTNEMAVIGNESEDFANKSAELLGLSASDVATAVSMFPSNLPYVFARFNPLDYTLRIDLFKIEKTISNGRQSAKLYHAIFGPSHGNFWRASRSYIHPSSYQAGMTPGVNPFAAFENAEDPTMFNDISLNGAQVAIGHAMRYAGAPFALLAVADSRLSQKKKKSGNAFRKKVTIIITGHSKPKWFMAQPVQMVNSAASVPVAAYCAPNPDQEDCVAYATASSGVSFEEISGGNLSEIEDSQEVYRKSKSGWGFLSVLIVAVIGSFLTAGLLSAAGIGSAAGTGAAAGSAASGTFGSLLVGNGFITGFSSIYSSVAVEAMFVAAKMAIISGANLNSMLTMDMTTLLGNTSVMKGSAQTGETSEHVEKMNTLLVKPNTHANLASPSAPGLLRGVRNTIIGDCPPGDLSAACTSGFIPRQDQYEEHNSVEFLKEYGEYLTRDTAIPR